MSKKLMKYLALTLQLFISSCGPNNNNELEQSKQAAAPNKVPNVEIISPTNNSEAHVDTLVTVAANATDQDGSVVSVEFFANSTSLGIDSSSPFTWNWTTPSTEQSVSLTAKATDNKGAQTTSAVILVNITHCEDGFTCANQPDGTNCDDGNPCTQTDSCLSGVCVGGNPIVCTAQDQCHDVGICNTSTGLCTNPPKTNGSGCDDNNLCTQTDSCQNGTCTGTNPVICTAQDQCHDVGACETTTGICSNPNKIDGSGCDDGNLCTQTDSCQSGSCTGGNPVICTALNQCHDVGVCDSGTGVCTNPPKTDGTTCNDNNSCTDQDACQAGFCVGQSTCQSPAPIVEYTLNESGSGQSPTQALDSRPNPLPLDIVYIDSSPTYVTGPNGRGLDFPVGDVRYAGAFSEPLGPGNKVYDAFSGSPTGTIEVVAHIPQGLIDLEPATTTPINIITIVAEDGEFDSFGLWWWGRIIHIDVTGPLSYPDGYYEKRYDSWGLTPGEHVFHVVWDSTDPDVNDRLNLKIDGVLQTPFYTFGTPPQNVGIFIPLTPQPPAFLDPPNSRVSLGNYVDYAAGNGGFLGTIYYASLYTVPLDDAVISTRVTTLSANNDVGF